MAHGSEGGLLHTWEELAHAWHSAEMMHMLLSIIAPSLLAKAMGSVESIGDAAKLTLPLTLAVAIIVGSIRAGAFQTADHAFYKYSFLVCFVLAGAAFLSQLLHVGQAPDWYGTLANAFHHAPNITIVVAAPLALLSAYFKLYPAVPFGLSITFGAYLGWKLSTSSKRSPSGSQSSSSDGK